MHGYPPRWLGRAILSEGPIAAERPVHAHQMREGAMKKICATMATAALSLACCARRLPAKTGQHGHRDLPDRGGGRPVRPAATAPKSPSKREPGQKPPAPYNTKGFAGASVEPVWVDQSGGTRAGGGVPQPGRSKRNVDVVLGYISSGTCAALSNVVEELKRLTVYALCSTPRVFDEADRRYIFRPISVLSSHMPSRARSQGEIPAKVQSYAGIHPTTPGDRIRPATSRARCRKSCPG